MTHRQRIKYHQNAWMIDVIGTDAGAPASLPTAQQQLIREAQWIAAPRRLQPALNAWLNRPKPFIDSDDPRLLVDALQDLDPAMQSQPRQKAINVSCSLLRVPTPEKM